MLVNWKELCTTIYEYKFIKIIDKNVETDIDSELVEMAGSLNLHSIVDTVHDRLWLMIWYGKAVLQGMVIFESIRITVWQHLLILDLLEKILRHSHELSEILL